jgi:hypothetical protein
MLRFRGSLDDLQDIVLRCAVPGEWCFHEKSRFYRFHAATGAIPNWWPSTGTINFQGRDAERLEAIFLQDTLAAVAQSEPGVVYEKESAWQAVPGPKPPPDRTREAPSLAAPEDRRCLGSQPSPRLIPRTAKLLAAPGRQ